MKIPSHPIPSHPIPSIWSVLFSLALLVGGVSPAQAFCFGKSVENTCFSNDQACIDNHHDEVADAKQQATTECAILLGVGIAIGVGAHQAKKQKQCEEEGICEEAAFSFAPTFMNDDFKAPGIRMSYEW